MHNTFFREFKISKFNFREFKISEFQGVCDVMTFRNKDAFAISTLMKT